MAVALRLMQRNYKVGIDLLEIIMNYMSIEVLRVTRNFNKHYKKFTIIYPLRVYVPRQPAGFGTSVAFVIKLQAGIYNKENLTYKLLHKGYFGETEAELCIDEWKAIDLIRLELLRDRYYS